MYIESGKRKKKSFFRHSCVDPFFFSVVCLLILFRLLKPNSFFYTNCYTNCKFTKDKRKRKSAGFSVIHPFKIIISCNRMVCISLGKEVWRKFDDQEWSGSCGIVSDRLQGRRDILNKPIYNRTLFTLLYFK